MDNVNNKYDNWYGLSRDPLRISISKFALISDNDIAYNYQGDCPPFLVLYTPSNPISLSGKNLHARHYRRFTERDQCRRVARL